MKRPVFLSFIAALLLTFIFISDAGNHNLPATMPKNPPDRQTAWVDSVFKTLTPTQRIAQMIMIPAYSNKTLAENADVTKFITDYNVGGIIFFQGGPVREAAMTNYWQKIAKTPLFVAIDGEWGLGMRLKDSTVSFPKQMTLGAIKNDNLIYEMGAEIASEFKRIGININFAPDIDINSNPKNPVIGYRSFGEDKRNVALKGIAYMKGMQDNGLMACGKHFPGHGDTDKDSHKTLPTISHSLAMLDSVDLYPFRELIRNGLASVMVAHLNIPALDTNANTPTTLSKPAVTDLLKGKMEFSGLVFTDAMGMKGLADYYTPGDMAVKAAQAGIDILLMPPDVPAAIDGIKKAIAAGTISQAEIDKRCKKILEFKYKFGLASKKKIDAKNIFSDINNSTSDLINRRLYEAATTLIVNADSLMPLRNLDSLKIATLCVGHKTGTHFQEIIDNYAPVTHFNLDAEFSSSEKDNILEKLAAFDLVIVALHSNTNSPEKNFGISPAMLDLVKSVKAIKPIVLDVFASPYSLAGLGDTKGIAGLYINYQDNDYCQQAGAEAIFGGIPVDGRLPVSVGNMFNVNAGFDTKKIRLKYSIPEDEGIRSQDFDPLDSIAKKGIKDEIFPGCQVLVAVGGNVVYHKSFGYHTYDKKNAVLNSDIYDLASLTKVAATTISIMRLYEQGLIKLDDKLVKYLPELDSTNKENIIIRNLMAHQAQLKAWIPFYKKTITAGVCDTNIYSKVKSARFPYRVAEGLYIRGDYQDTIYSAIIKSELRTHDNYLYSDLGFYLLKKIIEKQTNMTIDHYVRDNFYKPLGLVTLCYQPRNYFDLGRIIPSEKDTFFRKQDLIGDVNDQGAAMLGGIGGHAGLFSNSNDLAILLQMLLQEGEYGGKRYFKASTINEFTKYQFSGNRRGLGFDKPAPERDKGATCKDASDASFGHSGFTGTFVWVDPKYDLIFVFLSNRTYPYSANNKLVESGIRSMMQARIYDAVLKRKK
ncbi:MAG: glycoside hydrolase family 3 N-terminal domain-containing protein [Bacteroidota bacterium]